MQDGQEKHDTYNLQRFVVAQFSVYSDVCTELRRGRKQSHWMWFIFPQIKGLGITSVSLRYAISGREEAQAYLAHPVLGPRLRECTKLVNAIEGRTIRQIFYSPDNLKFRSCMTLFSEATSDNEEFLLALRKYFGGQPDPATLARL
jgi:uncharacterized protein (DUF1810 family)